MSAEPGLAGPGGPRGPPWGRGSWPGTRCPGLGRGPPSRGEGPPVPGAPGCGVALRGRGRCIHPPPPLPGTGTGMGMVPPCSLTGGRRPSRAPPVTSPGGADGDTPYAPSLGGVVPVCCLWGQPHSPFPHPLGEGVGELVGSPVHLL